MDPISLFLKQHGLTIILLAMPAILILILLIYLLSFITKKPIDFKLGPFRLNIQPKRKSGSVDVEKIKNYLSFFKENNTAHIDLIDDVVDMAKNKTEKIDIIRFKESMTKQMILTEEINVKLKSILLDKFYSVLKEHSNTKNMKNTKDYRYYQVIISFILEDIKRNTIKESIKMSEFVEYTETEFNSFVQQKTEVITTIIFDYIDFMYNSDIVSNDSINKANEQIEPKIKEQYKLLYNKIKSIVLDDIDCIRKIRKSLTEEKNEIKRRLKDGCFINVIDDIVNAPNKESSEEENKS